MTMIFDIDFNKKHQDFISQSTVASEIFTQLDKELEDYEKTDGLYQVVATYLLETLIKHDLPKPFIHDIYLFADKRNSESVRKLLKILQGKKDSPDYKDTLTVLRLRVSRVLAQVALILTRKDNLFDQFKQEFMHMYGEV
jgi:hypothetical protein